MTDSEAGFIFKCLPYIHYSTHALVLNPHEEDLKKVNAIRGEQLAELLGLDEGTMRNVSSSLKRKQMMMFINIGTKGKGYVINPLLADRGYRSEYTERAEAYFTVYEE
jgi:Winged helix-turn-helix transcription repressor, HrcA DNA-binding